MFAPEIMALGSHFDTLEAEELIPKAPTAGDTPHYAVEGGDIIPLVAGPAVGIKNEVDGIFFPHYVQVSAGP